MVLLQIQQQRDAVAALFEGWEETLIWSCLSGSMGEIYADDAAHPRCAAAIIGDFSFLAGDAEAEEAPALVELIEEMQTREAVISVPQNERWAERLQAQYGGRCIRTTRYATKKQADAFDRSSLLKKIEKMPEGFVLKPIGEKEFAAALLKGNVVARLLLTVSRCGRVCRTRRWRGRPSGRRAGRGRIVLHLVSRRHRD